MDTEAAAAAPPPSYVADTSFVDEAAVPPRVSVRHAAAVAMAAGELAADLLGPSAALEAKLAWWGCLFGHWEAALASRPQLPEGGGAKTFGAASAVAAADRLSAAFVARVAAAELGAQRAEGEAGLRAVVKAAADWVWGQVKPAHRDVSHTQSVYAFMQVSGHWSHVHIQRAAAHTSRRTRGM